MMTREEALKELLLGQSYRAIKPLIEGIPVQYLGVYVLKWGHVSEPEIGFVEWDEESLEREALAMMEKEEK